MVSMECERRTKKVEEPERLVGQGVENTHN